MAARRAGLVLGRLGAFGRMAEASTASSSASSAALTSSRISTVSSVPAEAMRSAPAFSHRSFASQPAPVGSGNAPTIAVDPDSGLPPTFHAQMNPTPYIDYHVGDNDNHKRLPPGGDVGARAFNYFILNSGRFIYASAARLMVLKLLMTWSAAKDVLAMASLEVNLDSIPEGQTVTVKWRGKPVFIKHRSADDIAKAAAVPVSELKHAEADDERVVKPEWLVVLGVCTHLGCVPIANAGDYSGWFCPCHGSHYDGSGRIRKGPAPLNLEVPEYKFLDDSTMVIG
ncbi:unnamed protein product [Pedinophyceae sp. YPF-701]|nr:unnamed protein product [Pedinophyceae sp. YPF-701]